MRKQYDPPQQAVRANTRTIMPVFWPTFLTVSGLTVLSLAVSVYLAVVPQQSEEVKRLIETCSTTWKLGFGALVGLIGGKALK